MIHNDDVGIPVIQRIEKIYDRIDNFKDLSYKITNKHRYDYYEHLKTLTEKRLQLEHKLEELKGSSVNTYDDIKASIELKLTELSIVLHQMKEKFYE